MSDGDNRGVNSRGIDSRGLESKEKKTELGDPQAEKKEEKNYLVDSPFLEELGVSFEEFDYIIKRVFNDGDLEIISRYYQDYVIYRDSLNVKGKNALHKNINRFYFIIKETRYINQFEMYKEKKNLLKKYIILPTEARNKRAELWLILAYLYVRKVKRDKRDTPKKKVKSKFMKSRFPPKKWLIPIIGKKRSDFNVKSINEIKKEYKEKHKKTLSVEDSYKMFNEINKDVEYHRFLFDLNNNWGLFVQSYSKGTHARKIYGVPKIFPAEKWEPKLSDFAEDTHGRNLFNVIVEEREAYGIVNSQPSVLAMLNSLPDHLKVGINPRYYDPKMESAPTKLNGIK